MFAYPAAAPAPPPSILSAIPTTSGNKKSASVSKGASTCGVLALCALCNYVQYVAPPNSRHCQTTLTLRVCRMTARQGPRACSLIAHIYILISLILFDLLDLLDLLDTVHFLQGQEYQEYQEYQPTPSDPLDDLLPSPWVVVVPNTTPCPA